MNFRFWLLGLELRKAYNCPYLLMFRKVFSHFLSLCLLYISWKTTPLYWLWQLNPPSFTFVLHICTALLPNHQVCTFYLFFWGLLFALLANNSQLSQVCTLILYCSTSQWLIVLKVGKELLLYRLFFLRSIAPFFTQSYRNCFVST